MASKQSELRIGFLTAVDLGDGGFVGGMLVADRFGRPLEFQCTTPVKPNRTQQLLYGPTLVPFILGELLAKTLVERVSIKPDIVLTNREEMLDLRPLIERPVLFAVDDQRSPELTVPVGAKSFRAHNEYAADVETVRKLAAGVSGESDLHEPLERVEEALRETLGAATPKPRVA